MANGKLGWFKCGNSRCDLSTNKDGPFCSGWCAMTEDGEGINFATLVIAAAICESRGDHAPVKGYAHTREAIAVAKALAWRGWLFAESDS